MRIRFGSTSICHLFGHPRLSAAVIAAVLLGSSAAAQVYRADFEPPTYTGSSAGVSLVGQAGWTTSSGVPFFVYSSTPGALGIPPSPAGGGQFIAVMPAASQFANARHNINVSALDACDFTVDFCCRFAGEPPAPFALTAGLDASVFYWYAAWDNPEEPTTFSIWYQVTDAEESPVTVRLDDIGAQLAPEHWYRVRTRVDFVTHRIVRVELRDLTAGGAASSVEPADWFQRVAGKPTRVNVFCGGTGIEGDTAAYDNLEVTQPVPDNILAFGLEHEPLNGATLAFDVDGNLVVTPGSGPGSGDEDVSVHLNDGAGLSFAPSPGSDLSQLGQQLTSTMRGTVNNVPGTLVARRTITGTGTSALLSVDFPLGTAEGQRARLYDDRNRLIDSFVIFKSSDGFTLTSPTRTAVVTRSSSNIKNNLVAPQPEHTDEFSSDMDVTHPAVPGVVWHEVRKIEVQSLKKQGEPIRGVDVNFGKKPAGSSSLVVQQEAADLPVPGSPKGSASFATAGLAVIQQVPGAVVLTEPPGGGPGLFEIAARGLPGELRRGKKRAEVEMEPIAVGPLAEGSYLKTTAHLLIKNKLCPPECYEISVTEKKVPGPLPVEISADFTDLGSTTHRVTVLLDGVVLGVHTGVGPVIGYAEDFRVTRRVEPAEPITRGPGQPVKGISVGLNKGPLSPVQISGVPYDADEIIIEPEYPAVTVEAIDNLTLQSQGLGSITVTSAAFEDAALLVSGLPVSALPGSEAVLDLDTLGQMVVTGVGSHIGGTGNDGCDVDLSAAPLGYVGDWPCLICGGIQEARYDLDVTTDTVSMIVSRSGSGGEDMSFKPVTPGGTYDIRVYKKGLKIYSATGQTGVALVLTGGTKPVPMEQFIEEVEGTTYLVQALLVGGGAGTPSIGGTGQDGDIVEIVCPVTPGAILKKLEYRLSTDRADAVVHADHAVLGPGRQPIAAMGEAELTDIDGLLAVTGLTDTGGDGAQVYRAISEKGVQVAGASWLPPDGLAAVGASFTTTSLFAGATDPTTTFAAKKKDIKRGDSRFDVTADFTALGSSTVHVKVLSQGVPVAELPGHGPDIGIAGTAPVGARGGTVRGLGGEGGGISSSYPSGTSFVIDGQTYTGDQLVLGAEGRAAADLLMGLSVTTVGYERLVFGEFSFEPIPVCLADMNDDRLVDFADYLDFLNFYDAQDLHVDFNQDGLVDFADYLEFLNRYDAGC